MDLLCGVAETPRGIGFLVLPIFKMLRSACDSKTSSPLDTEEASEERLRLIDFDYDLKVLTMLAAMSVSN